MQFTTLLALAPLALAAPLTTRQSAEEFTVIAARSGSPIHLTSWTLRNNGVFLGGNSSAYCPSGVEGLDCSAYSNTSAFIAQAGSDIPVSLDTTVPGGQQLYVASNGAVGYTQAHSGAIPAGASRVGFSYTPATTDSNNFGHISYAASGATGFVACEGADGYQVFADVDGTDFSRCIGMDALTSTYTGTRAWQFS